MSNWSERLAVFDLETTGVNVEHDRVVTAHVGQIGAAGEVIETANWLIDPGVEIPPSAAAVHGISTERARAEGIQPLQGVAEVIATLNRVQDDGVPVVAYNAAYDFTLLDREARRLGLEPFVPRLVIDPLILDKAVDTYRRGKRTLTAACEFYGVTLEGAHDASADSIAAGRVAQALIAKYPQLAEWSLEELFAQQQQWQRAQAESFADWKRRNGDPTFVADVGWPVR